MSSKAELLIKEAASLPYAERAQVVDELLTTLEPEADEDVDEAWALEVERRGQELTKGKVTPIAWDEVKKQAFRRVHGQG